MLPEGIEKVDINKYVIPSQSSLRGRRKKLYKKRLKKDVKKYSFPDRAIDEWNPLPEEVVCVSKVFIVLQKSMTKLCQNTGQNELDAVL